MIRLEPLTKVRLLCSFWKSSGSFLLLISRAYIYIRINSYTHPEHGSRRQLLPPLSDPCKRNTRSAPFSFVIKQNPTTLDCRALARLQSDHVDRTLVPVFYRYLQAQSSDEQIKQGKGFLEAVEKLTDLFEKHA